MLTCEPVCWLEFQSTLSVRRATTGFVRGARRLSISIHALRKESDGNHHSFLSFSSNFNPRSP